MVINMSLAMSTVGECHGMISLRDGRHTVYVAKNKMLICLRGSTVDRKNNDMESPWSATIGTIK